MNWLPPAMHILRDALPPHRGQAHQQLFADLADALVRGTLDVAFLRVDSRFDLEYRVVTQEPLLVVMRATIAWQRQVDRPQQIAGEIFIGGSNKAAVLRSVTEEYLRRSGVDINRTMGWTTSPWPYRWWLPRAGSR